MEFLLIWVLAGDVIDSGLRYETAAKCFSEAQNAASEMREVGLSAPQFTCQPKPSNTLIKPLIKPNNERLTQVAEVNQFAMVYLRQCSVSFICF